MNENPEKSMRHLSKDLQVSEEATIYKEWLSNVFRRVNADANAYVETIQIIVVKPFWIDSEANGGRPYVFQQDSPPSHKALKTQD
ncbi:hypothetical protein ACTXT7_000760 [Hymenolepis weldensis]